MYAYNGVLPSHIKELNNAIWSTMNEHGDYHTKWKSKTNIIWHYLNMATEIKGYKWIYLQSRSSHRRQTYAHRRRRGGRGESGGFD